MFVGEFFLFAFLYCLFLQFSCLDVRAGFCMEFRGYFILRE